MSALMNILQNDDSIHHNDVGLGESWQFRDEVQEHVRTLVPEHSYVLIKKDNNFEVVINDDGEYNEVSLLDLKLTNNCAVITIDGDNCIHLYYATSGLELPDGRYYVSDTFIKNWIDKCVKDNSLNPVLHTLFHMFKNRDIAAIQEIVNTHKISIRYFPGTNIIVLHH